MVEDYDEPDPDEPRVEVEVEAPLKEKHTKGGPPPIDGPEPPAFIAAHFDHPNGDEGIFLVYTGPSTVLFDAFGLDGGMGSHPIVVPFKHKADNGYNFESYEQRDGAVVIRMTRSMYDQVKSYLDEHVR